MAEAEVPQSYTSNNEPVNFPEDEDIEEMQWPMVNNHQQDSVVQISTTGPFSAQPLHASHDPFVGEVPVPIDSFNPAMLLADITTQPRTFFNCSVVISDQTAVKTSNEGLASDMKSSLHDTRWRLSGSGEYVRPGGVDLDTEQWQHFRSVDPARSLGAHTPGQGNPLQPHLYGRYEPE